MGIIPYIVKQVSAASPSRNLLRFVFLLVFLGSSGIISAQGDIKKSTKNETVGGKKYYLHTVEKKQTLYAIARAYDVTVNEIVLENPAAMDGIKPGQVLRIPAFKTTTATTTTTPHDTVRYFLHKVEPGQTLYAISQKYTVKQDQIEALNPETKNGLKAGQMLKIPGTAPAGLGTTSATSTTTTTTVSSVIDTVKPSMKDVYNVALFVPFHLELVDGIDPKELVRSSQAFPQKSGIAAEFYEGALLAIDSLKRTGMNVRVYAYDNDESDSSRMSSVLQKPEFNSMDLFIGPLYPSTYRAAARFAMDHHIAIVSPVSQSNKVLFKNTYTSKTHPSITTQMEELAHFVNKTHSADNVLVINTSSTREAAYVTAFTKAYNQEHFAGMPDTIRVNKGVTGLEALLKTDKNNILVVPSVSQVFVTDLARALNSLSEKYSITVYGLSSWMGFENLDYSYLQKLNFRYPTPYFIDYTDAKVQRFLSEYQDLCKADAGSYVFQGFDVTMYYLEGLRRYGTALPAKLGEYKQMGLQQEFDFYQPDPESGFENRGIHIIQMQELQLQKVQQ